MAKSPWDTVGIPGTSLSLKSQEIHNLNAITYLHIHTHIHIPIDIYTQTRRLERDFRGKVSYSLPLSFVIVVYISFLGFSWNKNRINGLENNACFFFVLERDSRKTTMTLWAPVIEFELKNKVHGKLTKSHILQYDI